MNPSRFQKLVLLPALAAAILVGIMVWPGMMLELRVIAGVAAASLAMHVLALRRLVANTAIAVPDRSPAVFDKRQTALAFAVSHEVRQPLYAIQLAADNARTKLASGGQHGSAEPEIERILRQCDHALEIVQQTCELAQSLAAPTGLVNLAAAVGNVVERYETLLAREGVAVTVNACDDSAAKPLHISQTAFEQVLANALSNAVDSIKRRRSTGWNGKGHIAIRLKADQSTATCHISDNGQGLSDTATQELFEPFRSSKRHAGDGFGLYVSQEIISRAGGQIELRKGRDDGACLIITMPLAPLDLA